MLFFFKLQQADWQLLFGKVFSPLPWSTVAYDTINTRVRRQRKLRKDYEDEVSDRIVLRDLFSLSHLESFLLQTKMENHPDSLSERGQRWWGDRMARVQTTLCAPRNILLNIYNKKEDPASRCDFFVRVGWRYC